MQRASGKEGRDRKEEGSKGEGWRRKGKKKRWGKVGCRGGYEKAIVGIPGSRLHYTKGNTQAKQGEGSIKGGIGGGRGSGRESLTNGEDPSLQPRSGPTRGGATLWVSLFLNSTGCRTQRSGLTTEGERRG